MCLHSSDDSEPQSMKMAFIVCSTTKSMCINYKFIANPMRLQELDTNRINISMMLLLFCNHTLQPIYQLLLLHIYIAICANS